MVATSASGFIVTMADADALPEAESVTVALIVNVPFTEYVVLKLVPEPVAGVPPVAVQLKV